MRPLGRFAVPDLLRSLVLREEKSIVDLEVLNGDLAESTSHPLTPQRRTTLLTCDRHFTRAHLELRPFAPLGSFARQAQKRLEVTCSEAQVPCF